MYRNGLKYIHTSAYRPTLPLLTSARHLRFKNARPYQKQHIINGNIPSESTALPTNDIDIKVLLHARLPAHQTIHPIQHLSIWQAIPMLDQMAHERRDALKRRRRPSLGAAKHAPETGLGRIRHRFLGRDMALEQKLPPELDPLDQLKHPHVEPVMRLLVGGDEPPLELALLALQVLGRVVHAPRPDPFLDRFLAVADLLPPRTLAETGVAVEFAGEGVLGVHGVDGPGGGEDLDVRV